MEKLKLLSPQLVKNASLHKFREFVIKCDLGVYATHSNGDEKDQSFVHTAHIQ